MVCGSVGHGGSKKIEQLYSLLRENGFCTLDHISVGGMNYSSVKDFRTKTKLARKIVEHDLECVKDADIIVAIYSPHSYGTGVEMFVAKESGKRVILLGEKPISTPWAVHLSDFIVPNESDLIALLKKLESH